MMSNALASDTQFVLNYFNLPVRAIAHIGFHTKGGLSLAVDSNPHTTFGKKCRRRWLDSEIKTRCLEQLISKISRMICHNSGSCDIRILSGKTFI